MEVFEKEYEIHGVVTGREGRPLTGARVVVWWQRLRDRRELTAGATAEDGVYRLRYRVLPDLTQPMLLVVEALSEYLDAPLTSPLTQAKANLEVDLAFEPKDQSEWATLVRSIEPLLERVKLDELVENSTHQDISFLSQQLQKDTEVIMRVAVSARLEAAFHVPAPAFYTFLRQRVPAALPSPLLDASQNFTLIDPLIHNIGSLIFALGADTQTSTLTGAIALDLIGQQFTTQVPEWVKQLQALYPADLLNQPYLVGNTTLGQMLTTAGLAQEKQQTFAQALATNTKSMRNFWRTLGDGTHGLTVAEASTVERTFSVGAFVKNHTPLVTVLLQRFTSGTYTTLAQLASLSLNDWVALVKQTGAPAGIDPAGDASAEQVFASVVYTRVTRAYPTAALSSRISSAKFIPPAQQKPLVQFFQNNPSLELIKDNLPAYLSAQGRTALAGISETDQPTVITTVRGLQRVLRVAPQVDTAQTLLEMGIHSATQIAVMGDQQFFLQATAAGLTKPEAGQVFRAAAQRYAQLVATYIRFNNDSVGLLPKALGQISDIAPLAQQAVNRDQSLATLFGSQDYCATSDCTSILSPAAYLCDLLLWLRNRQQAGYTVLDVLSTRRPDIRNLLLNCPNTDTELPYIDLVNELLADAICPPVDGISTTFTQKALIDGTTYYYVVTAVNAKGQSAASVEVSATPAAPAAVPAAPAGIAATPDNQQVTLTWGPVAGADSYRIYWSTASGVTTANGTMIDGVTSPFVLTGLGNGVAYYYIVTAINSKGESAASAQVTATPAIPAAAPAAPTGLAAMVGDTQLTLTWDQASDASSYNLYWSTSPGVTTSNGTRIVGVTSPYTHTALVDGAACYYILTAVNGAGESAPSAQISATPAAPATVPTAPAGVTATASDGQITLSWSPVAGATSYNVFWSTAPGVTTTNGTQIAGVRNPRWKQTSPDKTAEELAAVPEYFNQGAYITIFSASYPFALPYSAGLDELRTYLQQWKLPLWQLRQALLPLAGATPAELAAVAAERFQIPPHAQDLMFTANFAAANIVWNTANPPVDLASVDNFTAAASITYEQLLELLQVSWVQDGLNIAIQGVNDLCMTSAQALAPSPLDADFLDRAHRFLRLWSSTSYKMWELDLLLQSKIINPAAPNAPLTTDTLTALLAFRQLQDATTLSVDRQLAFYQDIDTGTHRDPDGTTTVSLYSQLFLNPTVTAIAPDPDLDVLPAGGTIADPVLSDHLPALQAALGVSAADAATLFALTDNTLTLDNLSLLYRVTALATAAKLGISDLIAMAQLLTPGAANTAAALVPLFGNPAATLAFLTNAQAVQQPGLNMDALTYLLTPPDAVTQAWPTTTQMTQADVATALTAVQQAVANLPTTLQANIGTADTTITVAASAQFPPPNYYVSIGAEILLVTGTSGAGNTTWTVQRAQLGTTATAATSGATVMPVSAATTLAAPIAATDASLTVTGSGGFPPAPFYISLGAEILQVTAVSGAGNTTWAVLRAQQNTTAAAALMGASIVPAGANLYGVITATVAANAHSATTTALANDIAAALLKTLQAPGAGRTLLASLADPAFTGSTAPMTAANFPEQFAAIQFYDKAGVIVRGVRLVASELGWLVANATLYGGLDFTQLPITSAQPALNLQPLLTTLLLIKLVRLWTLAPPDSTVQSLYDVISGVNSGASEAATQQALAAITGWQASDIAAFATALGFAFSASYTQPAAYDALRKLEAMAAAAGATGAQIVAWGATPPDEPTAESMAAGALGVLRAQQPSNDAWLALAPAVMNPIRERRAAALQAYLVGQKDSAGNLIYKDVNGLFDHFLIDTQMSSCQVTSRVVQAYIAVQVFVERCLMNLEAPTVAIDPNDTTWQEWQWRSRYRLWQANREVFLYPENWLIESERPNRSEIYQKLEQEVRQGQSTTDYLETVVLNYIDRLDGLAHLHVTGTCEDPQTGDIYVVARTLADPPVFYYRSYSTGAWSGWVQVPLDIKAAQVVPAFYRGRLCLFWPVIKIATEPHQNTGVPQQSSSQANQEVSRYVSLTLNFTTFRNGTWAPAQATKGSLFDVPILTTARVAHTRAVEALYTLKVQNAPSPAGSSYAPSLYVDVFRLGDYSFADVLLAAIYYDFYLEAITETDSNGNPAPDNASADKYLNLFLSQLNTTVQDGETAGAVHMGRAVFDGRFSDVELNNGSYVLSPSPTGGYGAIQGLLAHAQSTYGPDARPLLPLDAPDPDLVSDSTLLPEAGALATGPANPGSGSNQTFALNFTSASALQLAAGPLLNAAPVPCRVVGPVSDLTFDPASWFFFQDNRRCYWVESQKYYQSGSAFTPVAPSNPASAPYEVQYFFHTFYHPFTRLFWNQLAGGGFDLLYDPALQQHPDQIDPSGADVFSFGSTYQPTSIVQYDHDDVTGQDRQFLDFSRGAGFSVYNWELFYHIPVYIAQLLSQNQQFEDARNWFHYVFNPTRQGTDPAPQRFWIPKPLHNLTSTQILGQQINEILLAVNQGNADAIQQITDWQADPYDPFLLADLRLGVPYMKYTVMSYLDNLIAWADNLFATQSREALSEATLLYVIASEILGPTPTAVTPPQHADESFNQLAPSLDAFANAMVEIENSIGGAGGGGSNSTGGVPLPQTFYFKIPSNDTLLGYWSTLADRLYKMRHCQSITGAPLQLALFDAPIDPGLLIAAKAAGIDLSSVLSNIFVPLPNYRFTALYPVALDFVNAVRAYGASLQAALEKSDAGALALLQQTTQQQLLTDGDQVLDWQIEQAQHNIDALEASRQMTQDKHDWNASQATPQNFLNPAEAAAVIIKTTAVAIRIAAASSHGTAAVAHTVPDATVGISGAGGSPAATANDGGTHAGNAASEGGKSLTTLAEIFEKTGDLSKTIGDAMRRLDIWNETAKEAQDQLDQIAAQIAGAQVALQIAQLNQTLHQEQIDSLQKQIDFLNMKFTNNSLYDWMASSLAATYFQSYQLAYQLCRQVERCYQFEVGPQNTSYIQFGYWDSLHKGLLAGETLNHDLRRLEAAYFQQNARRFEVSRFIPLSKLSPNPLPQLLSTGTCTFDLPESLFDGDYPGHYNRRIFRASVSVVYPNPGKFDNVKATLTLVANKVRVSTDTSAGYAETANDPRFVYSYAAVPQKIALGNAQDDPGLFLTALNNNVVNDPRYLPFENAGAISTWRLDMPQQNNEISLANVSDVVLHLYYTSLDGGAPLQSAAQAD